MGLAVTPSPYGISCHEALDGTPVEISSNGSGILVRYTYDGTNPANAKRGLSDSMAVTTKGGYPGPTQRPDGSYPPATWTP